MQFPTEDGMVKAVDGVSFSVERGKTLGIVGESGSGKSVTILSIMGLHNRKRARISGEILVGGRNMVGMTEEQIRALRGRDMAMIFQDPLSALHPYYKVGRADRRGLPGPPPQRVEEPRPASARSTCSAGSASRSRRGGPTSTRTSSPAACASAR